MSDGDPSPRPVSLPLGFLGMLALMFAVERFAARHEQDLFLKIDHWSWKQVGRLAEAESETPRIVCLGDSMVQVGIAAPILERQTGRTTCNLAISGGQAVSSFFLLRRALMSGSIPDAIVVDFFPRLLQTSPLEGLDPWTTLTRFSECADLAWEAGSLEFLARTTVSRLLPTLRMREAIRNNLRSALRGERNEDRQHVPPALRRNVNVNRGGVLCPPNPNHTKELDAWASRNFPAFWTSHPVNDRYLRRFLTLAGSYKIPVFWLLPPLEPGLQTRCEAGGFDAGHERFVRGFQMEYPHITVVDGRRAAYDREAFFDPHHLARSGAAVYSTEVARIIRHALETGPDRPRWVALPRYRPVPVDVPLEDLEQSRMAIKRQRVKLLR